MNILNKLVEAWDSALARVAILCVVLGWVPFTLLGMAHKALTKS